MSNIPKGERSQSKLEALDYAVDLRLRITQELMVTFGYSQKKTEACIKEMLVNVIPERREEISELLREMIKKFSLWFIEHERDRISDYCAEIVGHLSDGNSIHPQYMKEFVERRLSFDKAMAACNRLRGELEYVAKALPADMNNYMDFVSEVESEYRMIRALRKSDNRLLKKLIDAPAALDKSKSKR